MEFTQEELDELEAYLQTHPSSIASKSFTYTENCNDDEIDQELEKFLDEVSRSPSTTTTPVTRDISWDPEAVYYDLHGNIIYQPPKHVQTDLSDLFESTMNITPTTYYDGSQISYYQETIPLCR